MFSEGAGNAKRFFRTAGRRARSYSGSRVSVSPLFQDRWSVGPRSYIEARMSVRPPFFRTGGERSETEGPIAGATCVPFL